MKLYFMKSGMFAFISLALIISLVGAGPAYAAAGGTANDTGPDHKSNDRPPAPIVNRPPSVTDDTTPVIGGWAEEGTKINVWYIDDQGDRIQICSNVHVDDDDDKDDKDDDKDGKGDKDDDDKDGKKDKDDDDDKDDKGDKYLIGPQTGDDDDDLERWSCTPSMELPEGEITLVVNATDRDGRTSEDTIYVFTIDTDGSGGGGDTTPPAAPVVTSPVGITNDTTPTFTGTAEPGSTVNVWYLDDLGNPVPICQNVPVDASGNWSCTSSVTLPEGDVEIIVNATDPAGNTSTDTTVIVTIDTTFVDTTPPVISSLVRADPNPSTDPTVDYTITFSEPVTGVDAGDFDLQVTGTLTGTGIADITGSGATYTITVNTGTGSGTLNLIIPITATIVDLAGNPLTGLPYSSGEVYTIGTGPVYEAITIGLFRAADAAWNLRNSNSSGAPDISTSYGSPVDYPVVGDWDGDGIDTLGVFREGVFYLSNSNTSSAADIVFAFGAPGDQPIAGDWDGDGIDTIGLYRGSTITFFLRNDNSTGAPDRTIPFGMPGDVGVAGDWDGDGQDSIGLFRPTTGNLFLRNNNTAGPADLSITYGLPGDKPVLGDWNSDGIDTIGVYRAGTFYLRNSNGTGFADFIATLTTPGDLPVAGNWDGLP